MLRILKSSTENVKAQQHTSRGRLDNQVHAPDAGAGGGTPRTEGQKEEIQKRKGEISRLEAGKAMGDGAWELFSPASSVLPGY